MHMGDGGGTLGGWDERILLAVTTSQLAANCVLYAVPFLEARRMWSGEGKPEWTKWAVRARSPAAPECPRTFHRPLVQYTGILLSTVSWAVCAMPPAPPLHCCPSVTPQLCGDGAQLDAARSDLAVRRRDQRLRVRGLLRHWHGGAEAVRRTAARMPPPLAHALGAGR